MPQGYLLFWWFSIGWFFLGQSSWPVVLLLHLLMNHIHDPKVPRAGPGSVTGRVVTPRIHSIHTLLHEEGHLQSWSQPALPMQGGVPCIKIYHASAHQISTRNVWHMTVFSLKLRMCFRYLMCKCMIYIYIYIFYIYIYIYKQIYVYIHTCMTQSQIVSWMEPSDGCGCNQLHKSWTQYTCDTIFFHWTSSVRELGWLIQHLTDEVWNFLVSLCYFWGSGNHKWPLVAFSSAFPLEDAAMVVGWKLLFGHYFGWLLMSIFLCLVIGLHPQTTVLKPQNLECETLYNHHNHP